MDSNAQEGVVIPWLENRARDLAFTLSGRPGSPYGETMNAIVAALRSVVPGGHSYRSELRNIQADKEMAYPGAYSVIPEVRGRALARSAGDDMVDIGAGAELGGQIVNGLERSAARGAVANANERMAVVDNLPWRNMDPVAAAEQNIAAQQAMADALRNFKRTWDSQGIPMEPTETVRTVSAVDPAAMEDFASYHRAGLSSRIPSVEELADGYRATGQTMRQLEVPRGAAKDSRPAQPRASQAETTRIERVRPRQRQGGS